MVCRLGWWKAMTSQILASANGWSSNIPPPLDRFWEAIFDAVAVGVGVADSQGRLLAGNRHAERLLGLSLDQLDCQEAAQRGWQAFADDGTPLGWDALPPAIAARTRRPVEAMAVRIERPGQDTLWLSISSRPATLPGQPDSVVIVTTFANLPESSGEREERLRALAEGSFEGIALVDQGRLLDANSSFLEMFGYQRSELIGRPVGDLVDPALPDPGDGPLPSQPAVVEAIARTRDGRTFGVEIRRRVFPYRGRLLQAIAIRDVAGRSRDREEIERLAYQNALILNSAGDGIVGLDRHGKITFVNPSAARMTGYSVDEMIGQEFHALVHHTRADGTVYPPEDSPVRRVLALGVPRRGSREVYWRKDGSSFPVEYVAAPIPEGDAIVGVVLTFKDISDRLTIERMKDEFVAIVSHELRTPLTSIRGSLGLVASGLLRARPERAQQMLSIAVKNTDRLIALINDILDVERIQSGKISMHKRDCNAADLMIQAAEEMQGMADRARVSMIVSPLSVPLFVDPDRIVQVLTNLLSNAIKFSPAEGTIWLDAICQDGEFVFRIKDQGRGIPADKLERIFERFQQVDASDAREKGGSGLGLAICRSIVTQHGGRIWAESAGAVAGRAAGPGSTFFVALPMASGTEGRIHPSAASPEPGQDLAPRRPSDVREER